MTDRRTSDMTTAEHIARAKAELGAGDHESALVHALIAIAEQGQPVEVDCAADQSDIDYDSPATRWSPSEIELMAARGAIADVCGDLALNRTQPTKTEMNLIIHRVLAAIDWRPKRRP